MLLGASYCVLHYRKAQAVSIRCCKAVHQLCVPIVATSCTRTHRSVVHLVDAALVPWYPTVAAAVANNTNLSNFVAAVNAEGSYVSVIDGSTPFVGTIFAPTNA